MLARIAAIALTAAMPSAAHASDVLIHAAGSLSDVAKAFEAAGGPKVQAKYGPSGSRSARTTASP